jgi:Domain of unknown function (DUF4314)
MVKVGERVELVRCGDPYTELRPGAKGTVRFIDDMGTVHVDWDSGSSLGLIPRVDRWRKIGEERDD